MGDNATGDVEALSEEDRITILLLNDLQEPVLSFASGSLIPQPVLHRDASGQNLCISVRFVAKRFHDLLMLEYFRLEE